MYACVLDAINKKGKKKPFAYTVSVRSVSATKMIKQMSTRESEKQNTL